MPYSLAALVLLALPAAGMLAVAPAPVEAGPPFHCNQVNIHPGALVNGQVLVAYSDTLWLTPANAALQVTVTNVVGSLPPGLGFVPGPNLNQVTLTGVPLVSGTYTFTVELGATYVLGTICKVASTYTVTIAP
jgi:hypothetical protein